MDAKKIFEMKTEIDKFYTFAGIVEVFYLKNEFNF